MFLLAWSVRRSRSERVTKLNERVRDVKEKTTKVRVERGLNGKRNKILNCVNNFMILTCQVYLPTFSSYANARS